MKVINPISLARQALAPGQSEREEQQRVIELFRNRAELKKAYSELQDEIHRLKDRLKQQEGATARVQETLTELETRLGDPQTAYPALVFYQLRRLWGTGAELLRAFGEDLERQHVERERRAFLAEVNRAQFERRQRAEGALREAEVASADSTQRCGALERALRGLNRPWHHFKRRATEAQLAAAAAERARCDMNLHEARSALEALLAEAEAPFPGLSIEARRAVNLALVAFAEILCLRLGATPLLALARAAVLRRDPTDEYGNRAACEALMAEIAKGQALLDVRADVGAELRARSERLQGTARYRAEEDTIPAPETVSVVLGDALARPAQGAKAPQLPNVLAEDTWDIFRVLLR